MKKFGVKDAEVKQLLKHLADKSIAYSWKSSIGLPKTYEPSLQLVDGRLTTSIVIFYPEFSQLDFVQAADAAEIIGDQLAQVLDGGLPWDTEGVYGDLGEIACYIVKERREVVNSVKVDLEAVKQARLQEINVHDSLEKIMQVEDYVVPRVLEVYLLSRKSKFHEHFLSIYK